ncbi:MAG: hypothetical protein QW578_08655 [Thermoplasmatales archaeon]
MINNYEFSVEFKPGDVVNLVREISRQWNVNVNQMKIVLDGIPLSGKSEIARFVSKNLNMRLVKYEQTRDLDTEFRGFLKDTESPVIVDGSPISVLCSLPDWKRYVTRYVKVLDSVINDNYPAFMILVEPLNNEDLIKMSSLYEWDVDRADWVAECVSTFQIMSKTYEIFRHVSLPKRLLTSDN